LQPGGVHGGGLSINQWLSDVDSSPGSLNGLRSPSETMDVVEMVLVRQGPTTDR